jgi:hypothetical protein
MMRINLDEIPERFHILFNSDWNEGNESEMTSTHRGNLNELYLEYNKYQIKKSIQEKKPKEEIVEGGFDDLELFS